MTDRNNNVPFLEGRVFRGGGWAWHEKTGWSVLEHSLAQRSSGDHVAIPYPDMKLERRNCSNTETPAHSPKAVGT